MRGRSWPWVISIFLHLAVLAAIGLWAFDYYEHREASRRGVGGGAPAKEESTEEKAQKEFASQEKRIAGLTGDEKLEELKNRLDELDAVRFKNVRGATEFADTIKGVKHDRFYRPNPEAKGKFDSKSATLFDIKKRVKDGKAVYVHTLVDAEGRTVEADIPAGQMSAEEMRAFTVFEMSRHNPKLRFLVESALRIGENMIRTDSGEKKGTGDSGLGTER
jgi:hypothetical protein